MIDDIINEIVEDVIKNKNSNNSYSVLANTYINSVVENMQLNDIISCLSESDLWYDEIDVDATTNLVTIGQDVLTAHLFDVIVDKLEEKIMEGVV